MHTLGDVVKESESSIVVRIESRSFGKRCQYYHGRLDEMPTELFKHEVLKTSWAIGGHYYVLEIEPIL